MSSTYSLPTASPSPSITTLLTASALNLPASKQPTTRTTSALSPFHTCLNDHHSSRTLPSPNDSQSTLNAMRVHSLPGSPLSTNPSYSRSCTPSLSASQNATVDAASRAGSSLLLDRRRSSSAVGLRALRRLSAGLSARELADPAVPAHRAQRPEAGVSLIERHASFSALTRRQLSKLSALAGRRDSDMDSFLSEPVSYSATTYIASDMWLAQRGVETAERTLALREAAKREAKRARPDPPLPKRDPGDVFSSEAEMQDFSSKLVRMFFSGQAAQPGPGPAQSLRGFDRPTHGSTRSMFPGSTRGLARATERGYLGAERGRDTYGSARSSGPFPPSGDLGRRFGERTPSRRRGMGHASGFGSRYSGGGASTSFDPWLGLGRERRGRFRTAKKFRWWLRRVAHKVRGEYEYV